MGVISMYIEEMMIDYIMNKATQEEVEEFYGHTAYGVCTREAYINQIDQVLIQLLIIVMTLLQMKN